MGCCHHHLEAGLPRLLAGAPFHAPVVLRSGLLIISRPDLPASSAPTQMAQSWLLKATKKADPARNRSMTIVTL